MKNYLIYIVTTFFISVLLVFVLVLPAYKKLQTLNAKVFEKEVSLQFQQEYFDKLRNIADKVEGKEKSFEKIKSAIPQGNDLASLMNYFQRSASKAGVSIESISPAIVASSQSKKIHASKINLIVSGQYSNFKEFLAIVEKSARLIEIENIDFQSPESGDPFTFNLSTKIHYY